MDQTVSYYIALEYKKFLAYSTKRLKEIGVNYGQLPFIIYIAKFKGCTPSDLKKAIGADWGHAQRVIDKLIASDIVIKEQDSSDRRLYHLSLTKRGEDAFKISHDVFNSWDNEHLNNLSDDERMELLRLLKKLAKLE